MKTFMNVEDLGDLQKALLEAEEIKKDRFKYQNLGKNKTLMMVFFNNSLRTRLSTQKAAMNLGMNVIVLDVNAELTFGQIYNVPHTCDNAVTLAEVFFNCRRFGRGLNYYKFFSHFFLPLFMIEKNPGFG